MAEEDSTGGATSLDTPRTDETSGGIPPAPNGGLVTGGHADTADLSAPDRQPPRATDAFAPAEKLDEAAAAREWQAFEVEWERGMDTLRREFSSPESQAELRRSVGLVMERFSNTELGRVLDVTGAGDHPALIRAVDRIGRHIDGLERQLATLRNGGQSAAGRRALEDEADTLRGRTDRWKNPRVERRLREISEALHGTAPVGPASGFTAIDKGGSDRGGIDG